MPHHILSEQGRQRNPGSQEQGSQLLRKQGASKAGSAYVRLQPQICKYPFLLHLCPIIDSNLYNMMAIQSISNINSHIC